MKRWITELSKKEKKEIGRILCAAALFALAYALPLQGVWAALAFLVPYALIGHDVLLRAVRNIRNGQVFDENFLMAVATVGAYAIGDYPEAVFVMLFYQVGELFQDIAGRRSSASIAESTFRSDASPIPDSTFITTLDKLTLSRWFTINLSTASTSFTSFRS